MKNYFIPILLGLLTFSHAQARSNALEKEMEGYARDIVRAYPDLAEGKNTREARAEIYKKAKDAKLLELTKDEEKKLRKKDSMVTDADYKKALDLIKSVKSKKPSIVFLVKYAENPKIKADEKLLAYRLIKKEQGQLTNLINHARKERVARALQQYTSYKQEHKKAAKTLAELKLMDGNKYRHPITDESSDWIYLSHPKIHLQAGNSYIVIAEPQSFNNTRVCGLDNGSTVIMKDTSLEQQFKTTLAKIKKAGEEKTPNKKSPEVKKQPTMTALRGIMKKLTAYKKSHDGKAPASLDDLKLADKEKQYIDPASGKRYDWIYYGDQSKLKAGENLYITILAPKPHQGKHMAGLSDGRIGAINKEQAAKVIK